jgi:hypothetical protein
LLDATDVQAKVVVGLFVLRIISSARHNKQVDSNESNFFGLMCDFSSYQGPSIYYWLLPFIAPICMQGKREELAVC